MKVCILGAGAYGLALALAFYKNNNQVSIWTKVEKEKLEIDTYRENKNALPGIIIPKEINITTNFKEVNNSELYVIAIPINYFRNTCLKIANEINNNSIICIASKGIENKTNQFAHEILADVISNNKTAILSGPTFAIDLANNSPSGLTIAAQSYDTYNIIKQALESNTLKITYCNDLLGTEICSATKNIMAIAAGIIEGMNQTETTKSLFLTEAINETKSLIEMMGGNKETMYTLAGIGDLLLTCTSTKSRNFTLGTILAKETRENINSYITNNTVEGYYALISLHEIMKNKNIVIPLIEVLYDIIFNNKDKENIINLLTQN